MCQPRHLQLKRKHLYSYATQLCLTALVLLALCSVAGFGQSAGSSTLQGTVLDPSGAVVPDAQIIVTNTATGVSRMLTSNGNGFYAAPELAGGDYSIVVTKAGFKKNNVYAIHLNPGTVLGVNMTLTVGDTTAEVTVMADAVAVQTETSENGGTIPGKEVSQLMLNGRNFMTLATVIPGVTSVQGANQLNQGGAAPSGQVQLSVGGTSVEQTAYLVDGIFDNTPASDLSLAVLPTIDSIQEFRILKNNFGANYGMAGAGQVLVQTKSGGKQFHGTVYDYIRNNALGTAKNFLYKRGTPVGLHQNIYGYTFGGPLMIPHVYNSSRQKTFFFAGGEWRSIKSSQSPLTRAFFPGDYAAGTGMRGGDFTQSPTLTVCTDFSVNPTCNPSATTNPQSSSTTTHYRDLTLDANSQALLAGRGLTPSTCLTTNGAGRQVIINKNCMDPAAVALMNAYFPAPNASVPGTFNNYINAKPVQTFDSNVLYRIDHNINDKNMLVGRLMYEETQITQAARNYNDPAPDPGAASYSTGLNGLVRWTSSIKPNLTNQVSAAEVFSKGTNTLLGRYTNPVTIPRPAGFPADPLNRIPSMQINGGWNWLGVGAFPTYSHDGMGIITDDLNWLKGKHNLSFGGSYIIGIRRANVATGNVPQGNFVFTGNHTGDPAADFLLGLDTTYTVIDSQRSGTFHYRWFEGYGMDDYHITPRLVLNAGLRWSYFGKTTRDGDTLANFSPSTFVASQAPAVSTSGALTVNSLGQPLTASGAVANLTNGLVIAGQNGTPRGIINPRHDYFGPRLGFAYQLTPDGKTSVHGGYGIAYSPVALENTVILLPNPPFTKNLTINNSLLSNPSAGTASGASVQSLQAIGYDFRAALIQTFSLTVERQIVSNGVLAVGYAGNTQQHVLSSQLDQNFPRNFTTPQTNTTACALKSTNPGLGGPTNYDFDPCLNTGVTTKAYYRPYQGYDQILSTTSGGSGSYHSLQTSFVYRRSDVSVNVAYTFAKSLTDVVPANPGTNGGSGVGYNSAATFQNSANIAAEYGRPDFDRTHVFTTAVVYELPFFRHSSNFFLREGLSGWGTSALFIGESGFAMTPSASYANAGLATRPNQISKIKTQGSGKVTVGQPNYFVTNPYVQAPYGFFGNAHNGTVVGPREISTNVSATKSFPIHESFNVQLRVEAFNVFNHPNITAISTAAGAGNFGQALSAGDPRIMEGALRINF
jgi:hypothetical protein